MSVDDGSTLRKGLVLSQGFIVLVDTTREAFCLGKGNNGLLVLEDG